LRLALASLWILIGGALTAGVYWIFLNTPESTVWTVIASGLLALAALLMAGFTASGAIAVLMQGLSVAGTRRALRALASVIPAALILLALWWLTTQAEAWVSLRSGQISAFFIARFGWADVAWLFSAVHRVAQWGRWVVGGLLALSLIAGFVAIGWSALAQFAWLRRALRPRTLLIGTFWFVLLIALPWMYLVPWRPKQIPGTSIELAFIVAKLSLSAILFAVGAALIAYEASRVPAPPAVAA
jgi:hypothetical protein